MLCIVEKANFDELNNLVKLNIALLGTEDLHLSMKFATLPFYKPN